MDIMTITTKLLIENGAQFTCDQLDLFKTTFGDSAEFNKRNWTKARKAGLDMDWMERLLRGEFQAECYAKMKLILADYNAKMEPIWTDYYAKRKLINADYYAKRKPILADYYAKRELILFQALMKQFSEVKK
jgi:hypothetical protein